MNIFLKYGTSEIQFGINPSEKGITVSELPELPEIDFQKELRTFLENPIGCRPLREILKGRSSVAVIFSDNTRKYPLPSILTALGEVFDDVGIKPDAVTLVCGTGLHTGNSLEECRYIVGIPHFEKYDTVIHNAFSPESCVPIGKTSFGTDVSINRLVNDADAVILTGVILPHYYAGFSGGRKGIMPGVSSAESIRRNHSLNFHGVEHGRNPYAVTCNLKLNPIHEDMVEAALLAKPDFLINTTMKEGNIVTGIFSGDMVKAHEEGCRFYTDTYCSGVGTHYDIVLAGAGGTPKDCSLYQSHKAIDNAFKAVRPGGVLIVAADCPDGYGKEGFQEWLNRSDISQMEADLKKEYCVEGHTALCLKQKASEVNILFVSRMNAKDIRPTGMTGFRKPEKAFGAAMTLCKRNGTADPDILVIPDASQFIFASEI